MNLVELAQRIKSFRIERRLTLQEVASRTGLTRSWLSKVENFRVTPSLPALGRIAEALEVSIAQLVEGLDRKPHFVMVRRGEGMNIQRNHPQSKTVYESLAFENTARKMDPFLLHVPPGDVHRSSLSHEGEEFLMVLAGQVDFEYGEQTFSLQEGDCLYFDAEVKHRLLNPSPNACKVLCVFNGQSKV